MTTVILTPQFCSVDIWRNVVKHNAAIDHIEFTLSTDVEFLPHALVEAGFFSSGGDVKRKRPDLWRKCGQFFDVVDLSWAHIQINQREDAVEEDGLSPGERWSLDFYGETDYGWGLAGV